MRLTALAVLALFSMPAIASAQSSSDSVNIVTGALRAARGDTGDFSRFLDDGTEAAQMGLNHQTLTQADFLAPTGCEGASAKIEEIAPKLVLISWFCGQKFSGVRKTAMVGKQKVVALLGDVTQESK